MNERWPTEQEFQEWLLHPVSKVVRAAAAQRYEAEKERWALGALQEDTPEKVAMANARALGNVQVLAWFKDMDYDDLTQELADEQPVRTIPGGESGVSGTV